MSGTKSCGMEIFGDDLPENINLADLCDCGRHKRVLQRNRPRRQREEFPKTDYQSTFQAVAHPRPRSSKKPPPSPPPENAGKPMLFETNQRVAYKTPLNAERVKPIVQEDKYVKADHPLEGTTYYRKEFCPKQAETEVRVYPQRDKLKMSSAKFEGTTTNMTHFKHWVPQPNTAFGELPSFAGSILFPEKDNLPQSTAQHSFIGRFGPAAEPAKPSSSNIKLEGAMDFDTTNTKTFQGVSGDHRVKPITNKPDLPLHRRERFTAQTQSKRDFPGFMNGQPAPPKPAEPAPATIDLTFDNRRSLQTEQRSTYKGHDVVKHPAPAPCKKEDEGYVPSAVTYEMETSQRRDFRPIDVSQNMATKAVAPVAKLHTSPDVKFEDRTSNKDFFRDWGVKPRVRFGDFHENKPYIPPVDKFDGRSVTQTSYIPQFAEPVKSFKPEEKSSVSGQAETDYQTAYRQSYQPKKAPTCKAHMYLMQQELKRKSKMLETKEMANSLVFAK